MKNILITQKVFFDRYKEFNCSLESNWFEFFKNTNVNLIPLNMRNFQKEKITKLKPKGLILSGGNDLYHLKKLKENMIRDKFEEKALTYAMKYKIPILGTCRGFQFIANFFGSKILKIFNHVRTNHNLRINNKIFGFPIRKFIVNSYHNYSVKNLPDHFNKIVKCSDNSIEIAGSDNYKILCLMFHPERFNKSQKQVDKIVFSHFKIK